MKLKVPAAFSAFLLAAILLLIAFIAWQSHWLSSLTSANEPVVVAVSRTPLSAPLYIADEMAFFDEGCINVQLKEVIGGKRSFEEVISGKALFGTSSDSVIMFKGIEHHNFVNISTFVQSDNDVKIISHEQSLINSGSDLRGKRIGISRGTASEYFLSMYLAYEGIDQDQVELVDLKPDGMPSALAANRVDAVVAWEPFAFKAAELLGGEALVLPSKSLYTLTFNLLMKKDQLIIHGQQARCLLAGLDRAIDFLSAEPQQAQRILKERLVLDDAFIAWIWDDYLFKLSMAQSLLMNIESQAHWAIENELFSRRELPNYQVLMDANVLLQVKPSAVSIGFRNDY